MLWIGSVEPEKARDGDIWLDTASGDGKAGDVLSDEVNADNPTAYWRLGEAVGTTAQEDNNLYDGT